MTIDNTFDVGDVDAARAAWRAHDRRAVEECVVETLTLGAAIEAACWHRCGTDDEKTLLNAWMAVSPAMQSAVTVLAGGALPAIGDEHDSPALEVRRSPSAAELVDVTTETEWIYYLDRFRRSLVSRLGMTARRARSISAGFAEMADNVVQHAKLGAGQKAVVAYAVSTSFFEFAVGDVGRGVMASLRDNPAHRAIGSETQALVAAVTEGASRRPGAAGTGFSELVRAFADIQSDLSFRSGDGRLHVDGTGSGDRVIRATNCLKLQGFCVSVHGQRTSTAW